MMLSIDKWISQRNKVRIAIEINGDVFVLDHAFLRLLKLTLRKELQCLKV